MVKHYHKTTEFINHSEKQNSLIAIGWLLKLTGRFEQMAVNFLFRISAENATDFFKSFVQINTLKIQVAE